MASLLELPLPALLLDAPSPAAAAAARALLGSLARSAEGADLRSQALVELMALEVACGDELAFERIRHELALTTLPPAGAVRFRARVACGLARFGRAAAARRWVRGAALGAEGAALGDWLLELDRRLDHGPP